ncbi:MAG: dihydrodipicolinate synthase family protein [Halobacteriaceae archaeon]
MAHEDVKAGLRDVAVGLLTPFDADREIDHDALAANADEMADRGISTFLATANISEYHSLSQAERIAAAEIAVEALPDDATVLAGVGGSTKDATELVEAYDAMGVDAMMVMPPDHTYIHERGLLSYYDELAAVTDRPLAPYVRGFDPSIEYLIELSEMDPVAGIKYAITDAHKLARASAAGADDVVWVCGVAEPYAPEFWLAGVEGFSAGVSNFEPSIGLAMFDALSAGDYERAADLRDITLPYMEFRTTTGPDNVFPDANSVPAVKKGMALSGLESGEERVREPIVELSPEDEARAEELHADLLDEMERLGLEPAGR